MTLKTRQMEPLTIATLAGLTPEWVDVSFFDDRIEDVDYSINTDFVAITVQTFMAKRAYQIADNFRQRGIAVIMGGFHPTIECEEALEHADSIVVGQADNIWEKVCEDIRDGKLKKKYEGELEPNLSSFIADRSVFTGKKYLPFGLVEFGRGCNWNCNFCSVSEFFGKRKRHRPIEKVIQDVQNSGKKIISFVDDNLTANPKKAKDLFRALIPLKIRWFSQVDMNFTKDDELLDLAQKSGCFGVLIGFESLNKNTLSFLNKENLNVVDKYKTAIDRLHKHKIKTCASFILGNDGENEAIFKDIMEFCLKSKVTLGLFNALTLFPGTHMFNMMKNQNRLLSDRWWITDGFKWGDVMFKPDQMSVNTLYEGCKKLRLSFYRMGSILKRFAARAHYTDPLMYMAINLMNGHEVRSKQGLQIGADE